MNQDLEHLEKTAKERITGTKTGAELEEHRIEYLGRKGALTAILRSLKDLPEVERRTKGEQANQLRRDIEELLSNKEAELKASGLDEALKKEWLDVTRPAGREERGHLHPVTKVTREMLEIFTSMGFGVVEGPEVETEFYNFDALNIPAGHPAREMWDTFWLQSNQNVVTSQKLPVKSDRLLLRTHTSPVQVRYMEQHNPPLRIIIPGRVYRYEATDASHDYQFSQIEGLMVDRHMSIANFKAVIQEFFSRLFKTSVEIRLRPSFFPFTEPSFEVDISCVVCGARGCSVCKQSGWLELAGAGMVHPNVFKAAGYAPGEYQGFAFGMGIDRVTLMKYKIPDIRLLRSGDLRFLRQF